jgi:hypothetical protein
VFVPNSFALNRDARDWESTALVPWAIHLPRGAGAREIEDLIVNRLRLQSGDVAVIVHQPEPFLVRFANSDLCAAARDLGRFQGNGIDICLRPWRSLTHALGMRVFYRVRLYLDGVPDHAWTPDIIERVIGHHCALDNIRTDLVQPTDTRHIDLWAWTADPSKIPKRVWLIFTHGPADASSFSVSTTKPEPWHQGVRYPILLHLGVLEDYTAASDDLERALNDPAFAPVRRPFVWRYGVPDGAPVSTRSSFPARLSLPPRESHAGGRDVRGDVRAGGERGRGVRNGVGGRDARQRDDRPTRVTTAVASCAAGRIKGGVGARSTRSSAGAAPALATPSPSRGRTAGRMTMTTATETTSIRAEGGAY